VLRYIVENGYQAGDDLPTIQQLSHEMNVSVSKVRETLEVARALGVVEIKPGRGIRVQDFTFSRVVTLSALYAIGQDGTYFEKLRQIRNALEVSFWHEAVTQLTPRDVAHLSNIVKQAQSDLSRDPIQVPTQEHRNLHMTIFQHVDNPFVIGVLQAYWDAYDAFSPNLHVSLDYLHEVWDYHRRIVDAITAETYDEGRELLIEHMNLIRYR
jgi:DNA-binding FadR family transcriptional regulator